MTLFIAFLVIYGFGLSVKWYFIATIFWVIRFIMKGE